MTTPGTSLRDLFDERTASVPERPRRASEVAGRVTRLRRQRAVATVAAAVVAVTLAVGVPLGLGGLGRTDRAVPAWEQTTDGLKVWAVGSRLVAHGSFLSAEQRSSTLTVIRTSRPLTFTSGCSRDLGDGIEVNLSINGQVTGGGSCGPGGGGYFTPGGYGHEDDTWSGTGVQVGEQATLRFSLARTPSSRTGTLAAPTTYRGAMPDTTVTVGVYQRVDPAAYPLPPRPARLLVVDPPPSGGGGTALARVDSGAVSGGPNTPVTLTPTLPARGLSYQFAFVSPGQVILSVNGTEVGRYESWGYDVAGAAGPAISVADMKGAGVDVRPGEKVTITLTPSRFTDPGWVYYLQDGAGDGASLPAAESSSPATR